MWNLLCNCHRGSTHLKAISFPLWFSLNRLCDDGEKVNVRCRRAPPPHRSHRNLTRWYVWTKGYISISTDSPVSPSRVILFGVNRPCDKHRTDRGTDCVTRSRRSCFRGRQAEHGRQAEQLHKLKNICAVFGSKESCSCKQCNVNSFQGAGFHWTVVRVCAHA